jgi:NADH dehydrogenase
VEHPRIPGVERHALPRRSIADAMAIEQRLRMLVQQGKPLHIVIVGGSTSGIEALGEILRRYRDVPGLSVEVVEAGERPLPGLPPVFAAELRRLCQPHAVRFRTGTAIASASAKGFQMADSAWLGSDLTLWTVGLAAARAAAAIWPGATAACLGGRAPDTAAPPRPQHLRDR